ncbi:MAG: hypothetical protein LUH05_03260 [Candidatus Gastranaerophilales bacterium]|nr:hypothetical protein [Candidatus Gastranaerophilales bacterium]
MSEEEKETTATPEQAAPEETPTEATEPTSESTSEPTTTSEPIAEPTTAAEPIKIDTENPEESLKSIGFDYQALVDEYAVNGDLTKETVEKLNQAGITNEFIEDFINGKKAQAELELNEISQVVGGRESMQTVIEWAAKNLKVEEIESINSVRDKNIQKIILKDLKARMEEKEGVAPKLLEGGSKADTSGIFESQVQMFEAIRDKRYNTDPAYTAKVTAKIRASRAAKIDLGI